MFSTERKLCENLYENKQGSDCAAQKATQIRLKEYVKSNKCCSSLSRRCWTSHDAHVCNMTARSGRIWWNASFHSREMMTLHFSDFVFMKVYLQKHVFSNSSLVGCII